MSTYCDDDLHESSFVFPKKPDPTPVSKKSRLKTAGANVGRSIIRPFVKPYVEMGLTHAIATAISIHVGMVLSVFINWLIHSTVPFEKFAEFLCFWTGVLLSLYMNQVYDSTLFPIVRQTALIEPATDWILTNADLGMLKVVKSCAVVIGLLYIWTGLLVVTFSNRMLGLSTLRFITVTIIHETIVVEDGDYSIAGTRLWKWYTSTRPKVTLFTQTPLTVINDYNGIDKDVANVVEVIDTVDTVDNRDDKNDRQYLETLQLDQSVLLQRCDSALPVTAIRERRKNASAPKITVTAAVVDEPTIVSKSHRVEPKPVNGYGYSHSSHSVLELGTFTTDGFMITEEYL